MQINKKILEVKEILPFGSYKVISEKTGLTQKTVTIFFQGGNYRLDTYKKIMKAAKEIIVELN